MTQTPRTVVVATKDRHWQACLILCMVLFGCSRGENTLSPLQQIAFLGENAYSAAIRSGEAPTFDDVFSFDGKAQSRVDPWGRPYHLWGRREEGQVIVVATPGPNGEWDGEVRGRPEPDVEAHYLEYGGRLLRDVLGEAMSKEGVPQSRWKEKGFGPYLIQAEDDVIVIPDVAVVALVSGIYARHSAEWWELLREPLALSEARPSEWSPLTAVHLPPLWPREKDPEHVDR